MKIEGQQFTQLQKEFIREVDKVNRYVENIHNMDNDKFHLAKNVAVEYALLQFNAKPWIKIEKGTAP